MSFVEEFIVTFFQEVLYKSAKKVMAFFRGLFQKKKQD